MNDKIDYWNSCYDLGWRNLCVPAAFSHPAKFSRGLIFRIIEYALEDGLIQPGQTILDPFGGVALGALPCLMNGLNWIGYELEPKFVELGRQNIELWNGKFASMPKWGGQATLLQGDSRRLAEVVGEAGLVVGSPPYASGEKGHPSLGSVNKDNWGNEGTDIAGRRGLNGDYGQTPGQLATLPPGDVSTVINGPAYPIPPAAVISSPPFAGNTGGRGEASRQGIDAALFDRHSGGTKRGTGDNPANLDHLPQGSVSAVIGSPPYAAARIQQEGGDNASNMRRANDNGIYGLTGGQLAGLPEGQPPVAVIGSPPFADSVGSDDPDKRGGLFRDPKWRHDTNLSGSYGDTPGQLGTMKGNAFQTAVIASPPFEKQVPQQDKNFTAPHDSTGYLKGDYGSAPGQLGTDSGETFWSAARQIVEQCALILPSGAASIWVVKNYVKAGKEVDFTGQWQALCEACGFETAHIHRAMLVKNQGVQQARMDGEMISKEVARKSFFRRLHERKNPHLSIDWESVLCTRRA